jgi:hypothetical protein
MSKICPLCGGVAVLAGNNLLGEDVYECTICHEPGHYSRFKEDATVFHKITRSPEVLALQLVHIMVCEHDTSIKGWTSNIIFDVFETYEEAIAATVARLKEVCDEGIR